MLVLHPGTKLPAGPAHGPATLPTAHVGADLRQPGEQVQRAGHGADDKANDLLSREGLRAGEAARCPAEAKGEGRGPQAPFWGASPPTTWPRVGPQPHSALSRARLTLLLGPTDKSVRPWKASPGAATEPAALSSGVAHATPRMNKSRELMGADPAREQGDAEVRGLSAGRQTGLSPGLTPQWL